MRLRRVVKVEGRTPRRARRSSQRANFRKDRLRTPRSDVTTHRADFCRSMSHHDKIGF